MSKNAYYITIRVGKDISFSTKIEASSEEKAIKKGKKLYKTRVIGIRPSSKNKEL